MSCLLPAAVMTIGELSVAVSSSAFHISLPEFQRDDARARWQAVEHKDQQIAFDQRRWSERGILGLAFKCSFPKHFSSRRLEANEAPSRTERKEPASADHRRRARTKRVLRIKRPVGVIDFVSVSPEAFAGLCVEAKDVFACFGAGNLGVSNKDSALCDDRTGESRSDPRTPGNLQPARRERLHGVGFIPDAVTIRPAPLRPILRLHCRNQQQRQGQGGDGLKRLSAIHVQRDGRSLTDSCCDCQSAVAFRGCPKPYSQRSNFNRRETRCC